jgi:hypothetical protein
LEGWLEVTDGTVSLAYSGGVPNSAAEYRDNIVFCTGDETSQTAASGEAILTSA